MNAVESLSTQLLQMSSNPLDPLITNILFGVLKKTTLLKNQTGQTSIWSTK